MYVYVYVYVYIYIHIYIYLCLFVCIDAYSPYCPVDSCFNLHVIVTTKEKTMAAEAGNISEWNNKQPWGSKEQIYYCALRGTMELSLFECVWIHTSDIQTITVYHAKNVFVPHTMRTLDDLRQRWMQKRIPHRRKRRTGGVIPLCDSGGCFMCLQCAYDTIEALTIKSLEVLRTN